MIHYVRDAELRTDTTGAKLAQMESPTATRGPANGEVAQIAAKLSAFEKQFGFSTAEMATKVENGELAESPDLTQWQMLAEIRDLVQAR
jgi:hypothetical protein